jgi:hypothetical protein
MLPDTNSETNFFKNICSRCWIRVIAACCKPFPWSDRLAESTMAFLIRMDTGRGRSPTTMNQDSDWHGAPPDVGASRATLQIADTAFRPA